MARPTLNDGERAIRRRQLLYAAQQLYREHGDLPTVARIAQAAGVAKGSVYLSFATKEAIFIALLEDSFGQLLARLAPVIASLPAAADQAASRFAAGYADALAGLPELLPLAAAANTVLEKNLPLAAAIAFKQGLAAGLQAAGAALEQNHGGLEAGRGSDLLLQSWALTLGLWQTLDYPAAVRPHLATPALRILDRHFEPELRAALCALWRGALLPR